MASQSGSLPEAGCRRSAAATERPGAATVWAGSPASCVDVGSGEARVGQVGHGRRRARRRRSGPGAVAARARSSVATATAAREPRHRRMRRGRCGGQRPREGSQARATGGAPGSSPADARNRPGIVSHETSPPAASSPAQSHERQLCRRRGGRRHGRRSSPLSPTDHRQRRHREAASRPGHRVVDAARDAGPVGRGRGQHGRGQRRDHQRQAETNTHSGGSTPSSTTSRHRRRQQQRCRPPSPAVRPSAGAAGRSGRERAAPARTAAASG